MNKAIPYGKQFITEADIEAVTNTLRSDYLTQGPKIQEFEEAFADYVGSRYAVAVANGTAALHLGVMALGVPQDQKVITTPITFAASANCVRYCGGEVIFSDIDPDTFLLDPKGVRSLLENSAPGTFAGIIPVDFAGFPVDLEAFRQLADQHDLWILEDACHAPGGYFIDQQGNKQQCGNGHFSDLSIFSFHPVKHIAAGEGGMVTTNNPEIYQKIKLLRSHGITKETNAMNENHGGWYMEMQALGYNYRLTDIQAALGLSQLSNAHNNVARRRDLADRYDKAFANTSITTSEKKTNFFNAYHLYVIKADNRLGLYNHLREHKIYSQVHYIPVHTMPYYQSLGWKKGDFPIAENYYSKCLSLPLYPTLTDEEQDFVIEKVLEFVQ